MRSALVGIRLRRYVRLSSGLDHRPDDRYVDAGLGGVISVQCELYQTVLFVVSDQKIRI
jgi:hypothetical protein